MEFGFRKYEQVSTVYWYGIFKETYNLFFQIKNQITESVSKLSI